MASPVDAGIFWSSTLLARRRPGTLVDAMSSLTTGQKELKPLPARLHVRTVSGIAWVRFPRAAADGIAVRELFETAMALTEKRNIRLLVDLAGVPMVSSGLMGILVTIQKKFLHVGGQLHIAVPDPQVMTQFEVMNLHRLLKLFAAVDDATLRFKP